MPNFTAADRAFMARALALAERGLYTTTPNPRVGCVVVKNGAIIGEGWHQYAGGPHAEINALADAAARGDDPRGATIYVTLEPCNHVGRTPPCSESVVAAGVTRVVAAMHDPHQDAMHGAKRIRECGVSVDVGLMEEEAQEQNRGFISRHTRGRPWVRVKAAASLDGRTALESGESKWITSEMARADGHHWRARSCAVMTGAGTVLQDDPELTVRAVETRRQPRRIIVDRHAETPPDAKVLAAGKVLIATAGERNPQWPSNVESISLPNHDGRVDLHALMNELGRRQINELHIEGGGKLNGALLAAGLVDELVVYLAPSIIGDPARGIAEWPEGLQRLADRVPLTLHSFERIGDDLRVIARVGARDA